MGRGRKELSTKLHLALSTDGIQSGCLSEGQRVDMTIFLKLWKWGAWSKTRYVIADKRYDYLIVRTAITKTGKIPVLPRQANAILPGLQDIDKPYYCTRSAIKHFFGRIKENKRLALRFDK